MEMWEIEVRESVRDTLSSYHFAGDRGRLDELAACFHEDGTLEIAGRDPWQGRAAIRDGLSGRARHAGRRRGCRRRRSPISTTTWPPRTSSW